jgi:hypothetical protein
MYVFRFWDAVFRLVLTPFSFSVSAQNESAEGPINILWTDRA